jgi:5-methylcytosine-specific restriction enzyme subunit McrC
MTETVLELTEYRPLRLPAGQFPIGLGQVLLNRYADKVEIEYPTPKTQGCWQLTSQGWVGYIPLSPDLGLRLASKVPIRNLFGMLEVAYGFQGFEFLTSVANAASLQEYVTELAAVLAKRVLTRAKRGLYRAYLGRQERLFHVRGRINFANTARRPWATNLHCDFEDHTADVEDNQILAWGLHCALSAGLCQDRARPPLREAVRTVRSFAELRPFSGEDCVGRPYTRLNDDYEALHALCRFFIEHTSPTHHPGEYRTLPFLIEMAGLFEAFVAEWLRIHLPRHLRLRCQHHVRVGTRGEVLLKIDLVIERDDGLPLWVLDTKYKSPEGGPAHDDLYQVVSYAHACGAASAALIYPAPLPRPLDFPWHEAGIRVRTVSFPLSGDLDDAGRSLLDALAIG